MLKLLAIPVIATLLVGTVGAVMQEEDPSPAPGAVSVVERETPAAGPPETAPQRTAVETASPATLLRAVLGLSVDRVSDELCVHLGLPEGQGVVVTEVAEGSRAAEVGLTPYDVLLTVNQVPATEATLLDSLGAARGLELTVIRKGLLQHVMVNRSKAGQSARFLSSASLPANHPFRRYQAYDNLREVYASRVAEYSDLMKEIDDESRRARDEARQEKAALQEQCEEQVTQAMAVFEDGLLARVDECLDESLMAPLWDLPLDLDELLLPDHREEIDGLRQQVKARLHEDFASRMAPVTEGADQELRQRHRQRMQKLGREMTSLYGERVEGTWTDALREISNHRDRLGRRQDERNKWATRAVAEIRKHLHDRITCAVRRTGEQFSRRLRSRLQDMEVPAPGEVEGCIADAQDQIEAMAERFLWRTEEALDEYWSQVSSANDDLVPVAETGLDGGSRSFTTLDEAVEAALARSVALRVDVTGEEWAQRGQVDDVYHRLRTDLRHTVNDGRDAVRDACGAMVHQFRDHKAVAEDSWRDLERLLSEIKSQAGNDCWKLDGPHLDGRFPKPDAGGKTQKKGELAVLSR